MTAITEKSTSREQYKRQHLISHKARYEADRLKLLADHETKREYLTDESDLAIFDSLHLPSTPRSPLRISEEIEALLAIDGPRPESTLPDRKTGNYISGLLSSLGGAIGINLYRIANGDLKPRIENIDQERQKLIERLADIKATKILVEAGAYDEDFLKRTPYFADSLDGFIAGYEWALGRREDTGIDVRAEIDRFQYHPLKTVTSLESSK